MISYKSPEEIEKMRSASRIVAEALHLVRSSIEPGISTLDLDHMVRDFVKSKGGQLLFYRYRGFPANSCISINDEVVHGIPRKRRRLREGDIVSVDVGVKIQGFCGDSAWTFPVGEVSEDVQRLLEIGKKSLYKGIEACHPGQRISDIGRAIQEYSEAEGYTVVKKFVGHGIGKNLHEDPQVPNYVDDSLLRDDPELREGLVLAIEPMLNVGTEDVEVLDDGWTVVTKDRKLSVHFEHSVAITASGPDILTLREGNQEA
ncbi:MAG: type I methionyl aminopeptidase [Planctomycetota bacterium]